MSKMYDDLKRKVPRDIPGGFGEQLELFATAHEQAPPFVEPPPRIPESQPAHSTEKAPLEPPLFRRSLQRNAHLAGVIEPLSCLPPLSSRRGVGWRYVISIAVLALIVASGLVLIRGRGERPPPSATAAVSSPTEPLKMEAPSHPASRQSSPAITPAATPQRNSTRAASPAVTRPATAPSRTPASSLPVLKVPGARVTVAGQVQIVVFEEGIFLGATRLKPASAKALRSLAKQLAPYGRRLHIVVIGCTDNQPISPGSRFRDNTELGLARAREVANFLQEAGPLPGANFQILSYGERWAPYPNNTPAHRANNRTAVLRISVQE